MADEIRNLELADDQLEEVAGGNRPGGPVCAGCGAGPEMQMPADVSPAKTGGNQAFKCAKCGKIWW